jgi:hypothetical protein
MTRNPLNSIRTTLRPFGSVAAAYRCNRGSGISASFQAVAAGQPLEPR